MRKLGFILMIVGFLGAAFVSVRQADTAGLEWQTVEWGWYSLPFIVGVAGVVLLRVTAQQAATHSHKVEADLETIETTLGRILDNLRQLESQRDTMNVYTVHVEIDAKLAPDLAAFVDAREALIPRYGLQEYADLMNQFALGERSINRAWSASADGYIDEVWKCVERARHAMRAAQSLLHEYQQAKPVHA